MRMIKRRIALAIALLMIATFSLSAMVGCNTSTENESGTGDTSTEQTTGGSEQTTVGDEQTTLEQNTTGGEESSSAAESESETETETQTAPSTASYTVSVKTVGGMALANLTVYVYLDETLDLIKTFGKTDENGIVQFEIDASDDYRVVLQGVPEGFEVEESYAFEGGSVNIVLNSSIISDTDISGVNYELGDVMRDFTVTTIDGDTFTLSEVLKEKKMVLINFWYTTCSWCITEFPYMVSVYEEYKDDVEIIALDPYADDTLEAIRIFRNEYGLTFPVAQTSTAMPMAFNVTGYPTSVVVDRYGVICMIEAGGITSEKPFRAMFDHFTADDYTQTLIEDINELTPIEKPNVEMPSSDEMAAVFNGDDNMTVTYAPETSDQSAEFSWPFVIGKKDGVDCIYASNKNRDSSYSTLYANITLKAGEALAFDYYSSTEQGADILYVLVDRKDIYQISGISEGWSTCYPFVAPEDGEYELAFCYFKDESTDEGDDTVYMKNLRVTTADKINVPTYVPRYAATDRRDDGYGYENYATVVYNELDGYYHVGTVDGPILLADLMKGTPFSDVSVYYLAYNGEVVLDGKDYYEEIVKYCNYASNATIGGLCSVNKELKNLLEVVALATGLESENENQWLQMCMYYDAYGTGGVQLEDPIKGLAPHSAYKAELGKDNSVTYNRVIMPRGLWYAFTPEVSGAYRITSDSEYEVDGWIFLADRTEILTYEHVERLYNDAVNCSMVMYMEAGKTYYIDIAYYDVYQVGTFTFEIKYEGETFDYFRLASPGYFTFEDGDDIDVNETIAGGIDVILHTDGYYHELRRDGSVGSVIYADFVGITPIFSKSLKNMIDLGAFDFSKTEYDLEIEYYMSLYGDQTKEKLKLIWGEFYEEYAETYKLDEVLSGTYHGKGENMTDTVRAYLNKMIAANEENPELEGCIAVDAQLGEILQQLMDKYTFVADHSWTKVCYYYDYMGH